LCCRRKIYSANIYLFSVLTAIFPGEPGLAGFSGAKDDGSGGDNWSYKVSSEIITVNKPTCNFLQADALPVAQPTLSKH